MSTYYGPATDMINHPVHYRSQTDLEAIDVIEDFELGYHLGNAVKYILRAGKKGEMLEDLKKAHWYLEREISRLEVRGMLAAAPPPPAAMQHVSGTRQFSNQGFDEARQQMQDSGFSFGQSVAPERMVPRQICPADDVTPGEEPGTFISRPTPTGKPG